MRLSISYLMIVVGMMICVMGLNLCEADEKQLSITSVDSARMETTEAVSRWRELKYGMFIHYGL